MKQGMANALNFVGGAAQGGVNTYMGLKGMQNQERQLTRQEEYQKQRMEEERQNNVLQRMWLETMIKNSGLDPKTGLPAGMPTGTSPTIPTQQGYDTFKKKNTGSNFNLKY